MSRYSHAGVDFVKSTHNDTYDYINTSRVNLQGKAVFITGASKGIGKEIALSFARAGTSFIGLGARSSLSSVSEAVKNAAEQAGRPRPKILAVKMDVEDNASVEAGAVEAKQAFGRLDILINNAGYAEPWVPLLDSDPAQWKKSWSVNIFGTYHVARAFLPLLQTTKDGLKEILFVSSIGALLTTRGGSGYQSAKTAMSRLADFVGVEYPEMLSYSIHPGGVQTELSSVLPSGVELPDSPRLAGDSVVWLTHKRREWLQGRYVSVNWDMNEFLGKRAEIEERDLLKIRATFG